MKNRTKKQLRNGYGYFLIDIEINKLMQKIIFDELDATTRDPVKFISDFNRWTDEQGWLSRAGSITESGAGTRAADGVHS